MTISMFIKYMWDIRYDRTNFVALLSEIALQSTWCHADMEEVEVHILEVQGEYS